MTKNKKKIKNDKNTENLMVIVGSALAAAALIVALVFANIRPADNILPDVEFSLETGNTRRIAELSAKTIKLEKIEDSRCPSSVDVVCVWQGEIRYYLKVDDNQVVISSELIPTVDMGDFAINFVDGDEKKLDLVLHKTQQ